MKTSLREYISIGFICATGVVLIALQIKPAGWFLLGASMLSLLGTEKKFAKDILLIGVALAILGLTPISTDIRIGHMLIMGATLACAVFIPYVVSRFIYKDYLVRFPLHHGRAWYKSEVLYIGVTAFVAYFLLPYYFKSTGAYLNWPSDVDQWSIIRLFIGTNGLGIWDELFFVSTVLGILRRYVRFELANVFQSILFTSFLYELGFTGWGFVMVFIFAYIQGYIFKRTESLFYIITIHLVVDLILFFALIHAYHPDMIRWFIP